MTFSPRTLGLMGLAMLTLGGRNLGAEPQGRYPRAAPMTGTYELESTRGGNPQRAAEMATRSIPPERRDRAYRNLLDRLEPPQTLSIDRNGRAITIASSRGPRYGFDADGQTRSERGPNGGTITTRAEIVGNQLTVSTGGGTRGSDFSVTFEAMNNGTQLVVTRRLDDDDLAAPVMFQSYYRRTANTPRWDVYRAGPEPVSPVNDQFAYGSASDIPYGTEIRATLDTPLSMRTSRSGERFTMTVESPSEFQGARIDGVISRVDAYRNTGDGADMRIDFRTIQMRGRSSEFGAELRTMRLADGTILRVSDESDTRGVRLDSTAAQNGAIGATVGAIIGALAGGGKGAAVGALVGGAGGVILSQGHEQLDFQPGAEVTLTTLTR